MEHEDLIALLVDLDLGRLSRDEADRLVDMVGQHARSFGPGNKPGRPAPAYFPVWASIRAEADRRLALHRSASN